MLHILLVCFLCTGVQVKEVTNEFGGSTDAWTQDKTLAIGTQYINGPRMFVYSVDTGFVYLDTIAEVPGNLILLWLKEESDSITILVRSYEFSYSREFLVMIPRESSKWFSSADFDKDGDVDQSDFGIWQRNPSVMPVAEFRKHLTGVRQ